MDRTKSVSNRDSVAFMDTARLAAQLISGLEEIVRRIKQNTGSSQKELDKVQILEESSQVSLSALFYSLLYRA